MATNSTVLCIHRDPSQLSLLEQNGYELVTATNGLEGLRLFGSRHVDAIVLEYHLGHLDGLASATEIKKARPEIPIIMLIDNLDLPDDTLKSVDALVTKSDGAHLLWATVHFILTVKLAEHQEGSLRTEAPSPLRRSGRSPERTVAKPALPN